MGNELLVAHSWGGLNGEPQSTRLKRAKDVYQIGSLKKPQSLPSFGLRSNKYRKFMDSDTGRTFAATVVYGMVRGKEVGE